MKNKLIHIVLVILLLLANPYSCGKEYPFADDADCDECFTDKPETGEMIIKLSEDKLKDGVVIKIYKGKYTENMIFDDSKLIYNDTIYNKPDDIFVPLDQYYSVVAQYKVDGIKYNVVDGDKIKLYSIKSTCGFACWIIRGGEVNCRLKF
jgi:hypothetical protein